MYKDSQDPHTQYQNNMANSLPSYLHLTENLRSTLRQAVDQESPDKVGILVDENTKVHCLPLLDLSADKIIEIKSGESEKNIASCQHIWSELTEAHFSRKSLLINLGGGVIGDMGGFAAATFKRGIPFINVPTTLLSQVDASIGGKLGVDFNGLKNHIGVFQQPSHIIIYPSFLKTLESRQLNSGFAEVIKHGLIYDATYWEEIKNHSKEEMDWMSLIQKSIQIKNDIVAQDPLEKGLRKILNFGHTLGHAIESHFLETPSPLLHGEAIAIGMVLEAHLSLQLHNISASEFEDIHSFIGLHFEYPELPKRHLLDAFLKQDKKNQHGNVQYALLKGIGRCTYDIEVSEEMIQLSLNAYDQMKSS